MTTEHQVSPEEFERRQAVLEDFRGLSVHISPELRANLEATLTPEAREHVLSLQLLAIQYGRALERRDWENALARQSQPQIIVGNVNQTASELARSLIARLKDQ